MTKILCLGAGGPACNNFVDALRQTEDDFEFVGVDSNKYFLELSSIENRYLVPSVSDKQYSSTLNKIIVEEHIDFVHPQPDIEVAYLSAHPLDAPTFLPDEIVVASCQDKAVCHSILERANVPVPRRYDIGMAKNLLHGRQPYWLRAIHGAGSKAALPVKTVVQMDGWLDYWSGKGLFHNEFMLCDFLPGREYAWQSLWYRGELISCQARERVEYVNGSLMPSGQSSSPSVAKTVTRVDVNVIGQAAVSAISKEPHGVFCVDMKENRDGTPCVSEINAGRFFTTSNFFAHAGLNMPAMYVDLALTGKTDRDRTPLPDDLYWLRLIDMGFKLVQGDQWTHN